MQITIVIIMVESKYVKLMVMFTILNKDFIKFIISKQVMSIYVKFIEPFL